MSIEKLSVYCERLLLIVSNSFIIRGKLCSTIMRNSSCSFEFPWITIREILHVLVLFLYFLITNAVLLLSLRTILGRVTPKQFNRIELENFELLDRTFKSDRSSKPIERSKFWTKLDPTELWDRTEQRIELRSKMAAMQFLHKSWKLLYSSVELVFNCLIDVYSPFHCYHRFYLVENSSGNRNTSGFFKNINQQKFYSRFKNHVYFLWEISKIRFLLKSIHTYSLGKSDGLSFFPVALPRVGFE